MINNGLNLELEKQHRSDEDWVFGAASPDCIASIPEDDREQYLPQGEVQKGVEDMMDCASRGPVNILETKFNWLYRNNKLSKENKKWLEDNGYVTEGTVTFSDAFVAINSGTTRYGNSLIAPLQAIHEFGLIPKHEMPLESSMTFDEYHNRNRITPRLASLGYDFNRRFLVNYERVEASHYGVVFKKDMVVMAGYAWPDPVNGKYPRVNDPFNHVFDGIKNPLYVIFDNYIDDVDGDFIKVLEPDYKLFEYGYRVYISESAVAEVKKKSLWERIQDWLNRWYNIRNLFPKLSTA